MLVTFICLHTSIVAFTSSGWNASSLDVFKPSAPLNLRMVSARFCTFYQRYWLHFANLTMALLPSACDRRIAPGPTHSQVDPLT